MLLTLLLLGGVHMPCLVCEIFLTLVTVAFCLYLTIII